MKNIASIVLTATLLLGLCLPALAAEDLLLLAPDDGNGTEAVLEELDPSELPELSTDLIMPVFTPPAEAKLLPASMYGTIIDETETSITVQNGMNEDDIIVLHLPERPYIVDAVTGQAAALKDRENDRVAVFYGPATTFSLPPQSNAIAIAVNLPEQKFSPSYAVVEAVVHEDGAVKVVVNNGSLHVTIAEDVPMLPYLTRNLVTLHDIRPGAALLLWYDVVALSYPGRAAAQRVVVLKGAPSEEITVNPETGLALVGGETLELVGVRFFAEGGLALPMRQLCEALGYSVTWLPEYDSVELTRDGVTAVMQFGSPTCVIAGLVVTLSEAPLVEDGVTYVAPDFFETLLSTFVTIETE